MSTVVIVKNNSGNISYWDSYNQNVSHKKRNKNTYTIIRCTNNELIARSAIEKADKGLADENFY